MEHSAEPQRALSLLTMIADNEKNYRAKRNHYVEACLIILGIEKVEPRHCPCGIRECADGKIWAAPVEPADGSGAAQAPGNPAEPIVLKPRSPRKPQRRDLVWELRAIKIDVPHAAAAALAHFCKQRRPCRERQGCVRDLPLRVRAD